MFAYARFRWELFRNERMRRQTHKEYERALAAARARKATGDEIERITSDAMRDDYELDDDVHQLHADYLMSEGRRLVIPTPDWKDEESWTRGIISGRRQLTKKGITELRAAIRSEKRARAERFLIWVPGLVGILGALIGLASIVYRK